MSALEKVAQDAMKYCRGGEWPEWIKEGLNYSLTYFLTF